MEFENDVFGSGSAITENQETLELLEHKLRKSKKKMKKWKKRGNKGKKVKKIKKTIRKLEKRLARTEVRFQQEVKLRSERSIWADIANQTVPVAIPLLLDRLLPPKK